MPKLTKLALTCATILTFSSISFGQQTEAEKALERKLEQGQKKEKKIKTQKVTSVTEKVTADDANLTPRDKEIKLRAREIELQNEIKKIEVKKRSLEVPSERQARKEIEHREKYERDAKRNEREAREFAQITGCNPESVWVSPLAERRAYGFVNVNYTVTNKEVIASVDIRDNHLGKLVVRNLGPGCSMTLRKVISLDGSYQTPVSYMATGMVSGRAVTNNSPTTSLYSGQAQYQSAQQPIIWEIRLY